jgi:lycopene beta-cyclase
MSSDHAFDLVILGGGCAGLSLAAKLAQAGQDCPRCLVIELRAQYLNDRTWCFFADASTRAQHLVQYAWPAVALNCGVERVKVACPATPYQMIEAQAFYTEALEQIQRNSRITLLTGCEVTAVEQNESLSWNITTKQGVFQATSVIDTRPAVQPQFVGPHLWQSFFGQVLRVDRDLFEPGCVELMQFDEDTEYGVSFTYILPFDARSALIETTVFYKLPVNQAALRARLERKIKAMLNDQGFTVLRQEYGVLPMGVVQTSKTLRPGLVQAGLTAGAARPSSGYAFQRIQRWAASCAGAILAGKSAVSHTDDSWLARSMDSLFLRVLRESPEQGPAIFMRMFSSMKVVRIVRFMNDQATLLDRLALIKSMPLATFLKQLPFALIGRP